MPIYVVPWVVTMRIAVVAIGFLLISDFNAILVSVAILLLCIVFETACKGISSLPAGAFIQANVT